MDTPFPNRRTYSIIQTTSLFGSLKRVHKTFSICTGIKTPTRYRKKFCTSSDVLTFLPNWSATEQWVLQSFSHSDMPFPVSDKCCPDNIRFVLPRSWQGSVFPYLLNRSAAETAIDSGIPAVLPVPAKLLFFVFPVPLLFPAAMADS